MNSRKRTIITAILLFAISFLLPISARAERIENYDITVGIEKDASLRVEEVIAYDFENSYRHGIFRTIPIKATLDEKQRRIRVTNMVVTDEKGRVQQSETTQSGGILTIKIGNPDSTVTGKHIYIIRYHVSGATLWNQDEDVVSWNAIGMDWQVPIEKSTVRISWPENISSQDIKVQCFVGTLGSQQACQQEQKESRSQIFTTQSTLSLGEGVTVSARFPAGTLEQPLTSQQWFLWLITALPFSLPIAVAAFMGRLWWKTGRDPEGKKTIVPQFDAPDNLSPVEVATILDEKVDKKDISTLFVDLAQRGYIAIERIEKKKLLILSETDYRFDLRKEPDNLLAPFEKLFLEEIFGNFTSRHLSQLKNNFYKSIPTIEKAVYTALVDKGYFPKNPNTVRGKYIAWGLGIIFVCFFLGSLLGSWQNLVACILSGIIILGFGFIMPAKTRKGVLAREHVLGLKQYLSIAEKDRLQFHNAPEKNPKQFEKLLALAVALGVEEAWAKQFEGIYTQPPEWYRGSTGTSFHPGVFASDLRSFSTASIATLTSSPSSSSGSFGGSSGGGFGGGGGGSW